MSQPQVATTGKTNTSLLIRGAIWIAIGALIAAALVCVIWVLVGDQDGLIGRAFLTILLLAAFAGIAILEAGLAPNRPDWLALTSMVTWIVALLAGAVKIWLPEDDEYFGGAERFFQLLLIVGILQLALLHVRLFTPAAARHVTTFTRIIYIATLVFLGALVALLVFFLTFPQVFDYSELYWRIVVALTILAAVGTTLIPLLNALFAPRKPIGARASAPAAAPSWPTYADGITALPALHDGSPDWNAYYTGHPSSSSQGQTQTAPALGTLPPSSFPVATPPTPPAPTPTPPAPAGAGVGTTQPAPPSPPAPPVPPAPEMPRPPAAPEQGGHPVFPSAPPVAPQPPQ